MEGQGYFVGLDYHNNVRQYCIQVTLGSNSLCDCCKSLVHRDLVFLMENKCNKNRLACPPELVEKYTREKT